MAAVYLFGSAAPARPRADSDIGRRSGDRDASAPSSPPYARKRLERRLGDLGASSKRAPADCARACSATGHLGLDRAPSRPDSIRVRTETSFDLEPILRGQGATEAGDDPDLLAKKLALSNSVATPAAERPSDCARPARGRSSITPADLPSAALDVSSHIVSDDRLEAATAANYSTLPNAHDGSRRRSRVRAPHVGFRNVLVHATMMSICLRRAECDTSSPLSWIRRNRAAQL